MTQLEHQLRLSISYVQMQKTLRLAIPLLRKEYESFAQVMAQNKGRSSFVLDAMQAQHDEWLTALMQAEAALKGASTPLVICEEVYR